VIAHLARVHVTQLHEAAQQNPILPDLTELIIGFICFVIVFGVLAKVLLPRIQTTLAERTDAIEGGLKRAEEAQAEAQRTLEQYREQMRDAHHAAARLRQEAQEEGSRIIQQMRDEAQRQRESIVATGHAQVEADVQAARSALRQDIGRLALELAGKIVGETVADDARQSRIIDRFLDDLEARADRQATAGASEQVS
jgi:F-type H+-transporting ATPase subunit b